MLTPARPRGGPFLIQAAIPLTSEAIRARSEAAREPGWLTDARLAAHAQWAKMPSPEKPEWPRTPAGKVDLGAAAAILAGKPDASRVGAPSVKGLTVMDLSTAAREHPEVVRAALHAAIRPEEGPVEALLAAAWTTGVLVHVERGVEVAEPVTIDALAPRGGRLARTLVVAEPLSKVSVVERLRSADDAPGLVGSAVEILPKDGAKAHYASVQDLAQSATHVFAKRAVHARDSSVSWVDAQFGAGVARGSLESLLAGAGSSAVILSAFFGDAKQHFDASTALLHRARATSGEIRAKGALLDEAYSYYAGLVSIGHDAPGSSGHLTEHTLLLSEKAHADAIPKLDVENNDVQASHGASVGQVDADQLFYIQSRGLDRRTALRVLVEGFFEPLLKEIPSDAVREELALAITRRMS